MMTGATDCTCAAKIDVHSNAQYSISVIDPIIRRITIGIPYVIFLASDPGW